MYACNDSSENGDVLPPVWGFPQEKIIKKQNGREEKHLGDTAVKKANNMTLGDKIDLELNPCSAV